MNIDKYKIWTNYINKDNLITNNHFTFIQIPKTSCTNVLVNCHKQNLTKLLDCYRHEGLLYLENVIDITLPIYTIVRNPYQHILSYFFHQLLHKEYTLNENIDIIENFENFVKLNVNNIHLQQIRYLKSNKDIKVKIFKFENHNLNQYIIDNHGINLNLDKTHYNRNVLRDKYDHINIKKFFRNDDIINLVKKERSEEFTNFGYSDNINDA